MTAQKYSPEFISLISQRIDRQIQYIENDKRRLMDWQEALDGKRDRHGMSESELRDWIENWKQILFDDQKRLHDLAKMIGREAEFSLLVDKS